MRQDRTRRRRTPSNHEPAADRHPLQSSSLQDSPPVDPLLPTKHQALVNQLNLQQDAKELVSHEGHRADGNRAGRGFRED